MQFAVVHSKSVDLERVKLFDLLCPRSVHFRLAGGLGGAVHEIHFRAMNLDISHQRMFENQGVPLYGKVY